MTTTTELVDNPLGWLELTHQDDPCDDCSHWIGNI